MSGSIEEVLTLVLSKRTAALGTVGDGKPLTSLTSYAFDREKGTLILFLSRLARHTKNIEGSFMASVLIEGGGREAEDHPLNKPRVTVTGKVRKAGTGDEAKLCRDLFLAKNPESKMLLELKDFEFYVLEPEDVYYVKGFGSVSRFASLKI